MKSVQAPPRDQFINRIEILLEECHEYETWVRDARFRNDWPVDLESEVGRQMLASLTSAREGLGRQIEVLDSYLDGIDEEIDELRSDAEALNQYVEDAKDEGRNLALSEVVRLIRRKLPNYSGEALDALEALLDEVNDL